MEGRGGEYAEETTRCRGSHDGWQVVLPCQGRHHFAGTGGVLVHHQHNPSVKGTRAKTLSNDEDRLVHKGISSCEPQKSSFARRNPPETGQFLSPIATLPALSSQAVTNFRFAPRQI